MGIGEDIGVDRGLNTGSSGRRIIVPPQEGIVFLEDWEDTPDINIVTSYENGALPVPVPDPRPVGWDFQTITQVNPTNPAGAIMDGNGIGGTRGFKHWDESYGEPSRWKAECQILKHFGQAQYPELWGSFQIKFNPDANIYSMSGVKIFRMGNYSHEIASGVVSAGIFNTDQTAIDNGGTIGTTNGLFFFDIERVQGIVERIFRFKIAVRGATDSNYKISNSGVWSGVNDSRSFPLWDENGLIETYAPADDAFISGVFWNTLADGNWHKLEFYMKQNSAIDVQDGEMALFYDGIECFQKNSTTRWSNIPWRQIGISPTIIGWNAFAIGGNADNIWDGSDVDGTVDSEEQVMFDMDDIIISTARVL